MDTYADEEAVREVLQRLPSSQVGNGSSVTDDRITAELEGATAHIDARLSQHYVVPFNPVPELIRWICEALAAYRVHLTFRENKDLNTDLNPVLLRYRDAIDQLEQLATGKMVIPPPGGGPGPDPGYGTRVVSTITRPALVSPQDFDINLCPQRPPHWTAEGWAID